MLAVKPNIDQWQNGDRRHNRRREVRLGAHAKVLGRARIPCVVRNISSTGALIEFETAIALPQAFRLDIDADLFEAHCEVCHQHGRMFGVQFTSNLQMALAKYS